METFRGFIAVEVPVTDKILHFQEELAQTQAKLKLVSPQNIHITLKFLGDTPTTQVDALQSIITDAISTIKPHVIKLKGTGVFPSERYIKVIWIGLQHAQNLSTISSILNEKCTMIGVKKEKRDFSPHLTIGRNKSAQGKNHIISLIEQYRETEFAEVLVNAIYLKKSTLTPKGPIYETILSIPLQG